MTQQVVGIGVGRDDRERTENAAEPHVGADRDSDTQFLRTEFLERVAHELRGPIGVTMGALDELEMALASLSARLGANPPPVSGPASGPEAPNAQTAGLGLDDAAPRIAALLAMARRGTRKVLRTADRLSRAAQLETGTVVVAPHSVDLRGIVTRATQDATATEGRASIAVTTELADEPCLVDVDGDWMGAALTELVGYAIRASKRSVQVSVANHAGTPGRVCVCVTDDRAMALEPTRPRFSRSAPRRDIGLDMPLVQDVMRLHGGELRVEQLVAADGSSRGGVTVTLSLGPASR